MLQEDVFTVVIEPNDSGNMRAAIRLADTGVQHVVLRPRGDDDRAKAVQPIAVDVFGSTTVSNLFGSSVELVGAVATFASADVILVAQQADVEAILLTTSGEYRCNLDDTRILRGYTLID